MELQGAAVLLFALLWLDRIPALDIAELLESLTPPDA